MVAPPPSMLDPAALAEFSGSVLVLAGENDALAPPAALEPLVARARHGRLVVVSEADHFFAAGLAEVSRVTGAWLGTGASQ
jgi:pimeloyl-ACP methyl ester carboxylesterase